jgi:hypothetical protein
MGANGRRCREDGSWHLVGLPPRSVVATVETLSAAVGSSCLLQVHRRMESRGRYQGGATHSAIRAPKKYPLVHRDACRLAHCVVGFACAQQQVGLDAKDFPRCPPSKSHSTTPLAPRRSPRRRCVPPCRSRRRTSGCARCRGSDFHGEQLILHDHGWIDIGLLHLVLDGIAVDDCAADGFAELDGVEFGATYGTAICALNPRLEACVVQVVSAGQKMGYDFLIVVDTVSERTSAWCSSQGITDWRPPETRRHVQNRGRTSPSKLIRRMSSSRPRVEVAALRECEPQQACSVYGNKSHHVRESSG